MQFETVLKPELAQRWRGAGEWRDETFFDILERAGRGASRPRGVRRRPGADHLRRAEGQGRALRRLPAPDRHQARRRRHHPAAEPHRLPDRLLCARADRRHRQQGQPGLPRARARLHPALLGQPGLHLPGNRSEASTMSAWRASCATPFPRSTHVVVAGEPADGEWNLEHGHRRDRAARPRQSACA